MTITAIEQTATDTFLVTQEGRYLVSALRGGELLAEEVQQANSIMPNLIANDYVSKVEVVNADN